MELHDPDAAVAAVAFVAVPFASTAVPLWWQRRVTLRRAERPKVVRVPR